MAGDAHEGSTGGVAEDSCRLRLLHVDREQRLEALAQEHESILCSEPRLTALQILELHPPVKGEREEGHLHEACLSGFFASRDKKANAFPGQKQELDSEFAPLFSHHKTNGTKKKMECGKSEDINNDPEVSRCLNAPTITLDNSCHTQYI